MLALETLHGIRVVASPAALDAALWPDAIAVLRFAADDVFTIGATTADADLIRGADPHAIIVDEAGFLGCWLTESELANIAANVEWHLPATRPALAQGYVAGVPAKLWLTQNRSLLLFASAYAADLTERLQ